jgi:hypothetical protein
MTTRTVRLLVLAVAACATLAFAATPASAQAGRKAVVSKRLMIKAAAAYIGVTPAQLVAAKRAGQSPAELAVANGKTVGGLTDALIAAGTAAINKALAADRITTAQAQAKLAALPARVETFINSSESGESGESGCGAHEGSESSGSSASAVRRGRR